MNSPYQQLTTFRYGTLVSSKFDGVAWLETDQVISGMGLPGQSTDSGGVTTQYTYDDLGRRAGTLPPAAGTCQ